MDSRDLVGRTLLGKLRVIRQIGAGGMGAVYEVEHLITKHHRALKVLHPAAGENAETVQRFIREAGVAGTLRSPYVVETFDAGQLEDGSVYVLMELLEGMPLADLLERVPPPSAGRLVGIAAQVLEGLASAHRSGIVHRDIKPDNLFLLRGEQGRERVKILDFGISKFTAEHDEKKQGAFTLTNEGTMLGTPYYMSPEQAAGQKDIDGRSDLYSLGVILYEGLAGQRPFEGQTLAALVIRIHQGDCPRLATIAPGLSPGLAAVVERAMSVDRERRYASARDMLEALLPFADSSYTASLDTLKSSGEGPMPSERAPEIDIHVTMGDGVDTSAQTIAAHPPLRPREPEAPQRPSAGLVIGALALVGLVVVIAAAALGGFGGAMPPPSAEASAAPEPVAAPPVPLVPVPEPEATTEPVVEAPAVVETETEEPEVEATARRSPRERAGTAARATAPSTEAAAPATERTGSRPHVGRPEIERGNPYD